MVASGENKARDISFGLLRKMLRAENRALRCTQPATRRRLPKTAVWPTYYGRATAQQLNNEPPRVNSQLHKWPIFPVHWHSFKGAVPKWCTEHNVFFHVFLDPSWFYSCLLIVGQQKWSNIICRFAFKLGKKLQLFGSAQQRIEYAQVGDGEVQATTEKRKGTRTMIRVVWVGCGPPLQHGAQKPKFAKVEPKSQPKVA